MNTIYAASNFEAVALDMDSVEARLLLIELESFAGLNPRDSAHFVDSAGDKHELTAAEISQLVHGARRKQFTKA